MEASFGGMGRWNGSSIRDNLRQLPTTRLGAGGGGARALPRRRRLVPGGDDHRGHQPLPGRGARGLRGHGRAHRPGRRLLRARHASRVGRDGHRRGARGPPAGRGHRGRAAHGRAPRADRRARHLGGAAAVRGARAARRRAGRRPDGPADQHPLRAAGAAGRAADPRRAGVRGPRPAPHLAVAPRRDRRPRLPRGRAAPGRDHGLRLLRPGRLLLAHLEVALPTWRR